MNDRDMRAQVDALVVAFLKLGHGEREAVIDEVELRAVDAAYIDGHRESLVESLAVLASHRTRARNM